MRRRALVLLSLFALAGAPLLAGCLGATVSTVSVTPYVDLATAAPGRAAEFALHVQTAASFREKHDVAVSGPAGWNVTPEVRELVVDGRSSTTLFVRVAPPEDAAYGVHHVKVRVGDGSTTLLVKVDDVGTEPARDGIGVQVHTVGFWNNGTIFYTNWAVVRDAAVGNDTRLRWAPPGDTVENAARDENMHPLKVYVGGTRGEAPPEPYNGSGYVPVIEGFDDRLPGMRAGETGAVRIPADQAYTNPRDEGHALYGDDLNFLIYVKSVDELPPAEGEGTCVEGTDVCLPPPALTGVA